MKKIIAKIFDYLHKKFPKTIPVLTCSGCLKENCANRRKRKNGPCLGYKKEEIDYRSFLRQSRYAKKKRHMLSYKEVDKYFLNKINRNKFHICVDVAVQYGSFIDDYNWEVTIYRLITDDKGFIKKEYWDESNVALVNSKYMTEEQLYLALYNLMER